MKPNPIKSIVSGFAVLSAITIVVSFGVINSYYTGYFNYFGIDINNIDFWPHISDFSLVAFPTILAVLVVAAATWVLPVIFNMISPAIKKFGKQKKSKLLTTLGESLSITNFAIYVGVLSSIAIMLFFVIFSTSYNQGKQMAETKQDFVQISSTDKEVNLLIYQNNGMGITKHYDEKTHAFRNGYKIIDLTNQTYLPKIINQ